MNITETTPQTAPPPLHEELKTAALEGNTLTEEDQTAELTAEVSAPAAETDGVDDATERFIAQKRIGERIKYLRLRKQMGLVELGRHTGLSASFLSQLETGRVVPTLRNLARIAMVFSKDLSYFFEPEPRSLFRVQRASERARLPQTGVDDPSYFFESLGVAVPDRPLDPFFAEFLPPKKGREARPHQHPGSEFVYILRGQLEIQHGDTTHVLTADDAVHFDSTITHSYQCTGDSSCEALIVTMQPHGGNLGMSLPPRTLHGDKRPAEARRILPNGVTTSQAQAS